MDAGFDDESSAETRLPVRALILALRPRTEIDSIVRCFRRIDPMQSQHSRTIVLGPGNRPMQLSRTQTTVLLELVVVDAKDLELVAQAMEQKLASFDVTINWEEMDQVPQPLR